MKDIMDEEPRLRELRAGRCRTEEDNANDDEAHALLALIHAEFTSDPMSVQCFDLRVVERVRACVEHRKALRG